MNAAEIREQAPKLRAYLADLRRQSRAIRAARQCQPGIP
jgi:hypothetical protein